MTIYYVLTLVVLIAPNKQGDAGVFATRAACEQMGSKIVSDYRDDNGKALYSFKCNRRIVND